MNRPRAKGHILWLAPILAGAGAVECAAQEIPDLQSLIPQPQAAAREEGDEALKPTGTSEVRVSEYMTVDIVIQDDSITNVLHKLAVQARRNIVPSAAVDRIVNATIYDVPFYDALEGLLRPNDLGFVERGDFIYVYTNEEMAALKLDKWQPVTRIIHLDYLRPEDARDYVIKLLSPDGHIEVTKDIPLESAGGAGGGAGYGGAVAEQGTEDEVYTPEVDEFALANAIVVQDYAENVDRIETFIRELDTPPAQVLIEATIVQTRLAEANAFGVDFALLTDNAFVDFFNSPIGGVPIGFKAVVDTDGNLASPALPSHEGFVVSAPGNVAGGDATIKAGYIGSDVGVFIRALDEVTDVTLLSNPKILTLNRQRAKVFVGVKVGYLETTVVENQVLQTVKFIDSGIILDIRPYILRDGRIRLELSPKVSDVVFRQVEGQDGVVQQIPDERIQTVSTDVLVPAGYTAVIGGLFREDTTRSRKQVPLLGDIPLAGAAFRGHDDSTLGLLPWSRERQTARLNLQAERLLAEGKPDKALHKIRRSLELYPLQPEIIRMQQELVNDPLWWPTRSYLKRVINGEFDALGTSAAAPTPEPAPE
ncbi:MAG: type II secretion system protein GspD [Planctomycetota bacterium]|jgi:type IV pilus assembly protein PilQ